MKWYLILYVWTSGGAGIDPCIIQSACGNREVRIEMPSLEVCKQVKAVNINSKCLTESVD